jgi:hypothetical protein
MVYCTSSTEAKRFSPTVRALPRARLLVVYLAAKRNLVRQGMSSTIDSPDVPR